MLKITKNPILFRQFFLIYNVIIFLHRYLHHDIFIIDENVIKLC